MPEKNAQVTAHLGLHGANLYPMATNLCNFDRFLPEGEELYDFQHVGVAYCLVQMLDGKGVFICDEQGLGKTRQVIVILKVKKSQKILIVAKNGLLGNWEAELRRCAPEWSVEVLHGRQPYQIDSQVAVISFDNLRAWADALVEMGFDGMVIDESHCVKSIGSPRSPVQRTMAALKISADVRSRRGAVLLLSGTPFLNKPVELLPQIEMIGRLEEIAPTPRGNDRSVEAYRKAFKSYFCWNDEKGDYSGSPRPNLLNTRMRGFCYARRLRNEVLNLDDTHRIHVPIDVNLAAYFKVESTFQAVHPNSYYIELLNKLRQAAGVAKIKPAVEWIEDFCEENPGKKLVVWAWHVPVQDGLAAALNKAGIKTINWREAGGNKAEIQRLKAEFNDGDARVIVCSLQSKAEGHTLVGNGTNVTDSLFVESPWHCGTVMQSEDRINRIGREAAAVFAHTLVLTGTVDEWLVDLIASKWDTFKATVEGNVPAGEEDEIKKLLIDKLRAYMLAKYGIGVNGLPGCG